MSIQVWLNPFMWIIGIAHQEEQDGTSSVHIYPLPMVCIALEGL